MVDTCRQVALTLQTFTDARKPTQPEHLRYSGSSHISLNQQGPLMCSLSEGTSQVAGNHALALLGNCARNQHRLERLVPPEVLQANPQKAKFFGRQTLAICKAY